MDLCIRPCTRIASRFFHQAGPSGHGPARDHQGDLYHAAVRQSICSEILWKLLQEHRSVDSDGILWCRECIRYYETEEENPDRRGDSNCTIRHLEGARILASEEENPP